MFIPSEDQIAEAMTYEGTCTSIPRIAESMDLSDDEAEEAMISANLETCDGCEWWFSAGELINENGETGSCDQCVEEAG